MLGVSELLTSELLRQSNSGRASALPRLDTFATALIRRDAIERRPRSTDAVSNGSSDAWLESEVFVAMITHQDDPQVQEVACRAVSRILESDPAVVARIGEEEEQLSLHNCVFAAMNIHLSDQYVFQAACCALHDLATKSNRLQQLIVAKGTYVTIIDHMRENPRNPGIQEWGFRALRALCAENGLQEELLIKYDLLTDIRNTLHDYSDNVGVLEEALSLLACLAADMDIVRRQCLLELTHERVVELVTTHNNCLPLLQICFETLAVFAASEEQEILSSVLECVESTMRRYKFVKQLQLTGCILTQLLASLAICENYIACANSVSLISEALINFSCDVDVQTEAAVAMKVLAELENGLKAVVNLDAYEHLFAILRTKTFPECVLQVAAEALMIIGSEQAHKDHMLQWALITGHRREIDWLLGIGADVNGASQEKHNIMIAAETSNHKMMKLVLSNGVSSHTEEALKVCQAKEDHVMIGLLLKHIGLERKEGMLSWANLNLAELRSEYFSASLVDGVLDRKQVDKDDDWLSYFETAALRRMKRFSSRDVELGIPTRSSFSSFDEECSDPESLNASPSLDARRPRSCSGASLAFSTLDPRLEGPFKPSEPFVRLNSPTLQNSYPGHPDGLVFADKHCGNLLPSPNSPSDTLSPAPHRFLKRASSSLGHALRDSSSNESSPFLSKFSANMRLKKSSSMDVIGRSKIDSRPFIQYADFSLNRIAKVNVFAISNPFVKPFFAGLVKLDLQGNDLIELPLEIYDVVTKLEELQLAGNRLRKFPYEILKNGTINVLNVSNNSIAEVDESMLQVTVSLTQLNISGNKLTRFPSSIDQFFPALAGLNFSGNQISKLAPRPLDLRNLRSLNLSRNKLEAIPPQFLDHCFALEILDLSVNFLITLPPQGVVTYNRLTHLKLSHNQLKERAPFYVPKFALQLQNLIALDISHNKITQVPSPSLWGTRCLRDLNLSHNRISKLNLDSNCSLWPNLSSLNLARNRIDELPGDVGRLMNLTSLNVSNNPLREIPNELGKLKNLLEFPLEGLTLNIHPSISNGTAQEICTFLYSKMKNSVPYLRMKLMAVGKESRGKSTLLRALQGIKQPTFNSATVGIKVNAWTVAIPKKYLPKQSKKKTHFVLNTWDFAGQEDFHCTHQCFMSSRALYLAVFDASRGPDDLEHLRPWLLTIKANAPEAVVVVVGTHADEIMSHHVSVFLKNLEDNIERFMNSPGFPSYAGYAIVTCIGKSNTIDALREKIIDIVATYKFKSQVLMKQTVPKSYVQLEDLLALEASDLMKAAKIPVLSKRALLRIVQDNDLQLEMQELQQAVKFLNEVGVLLHFDDPSMTLADCYFIHPEWLSQMMARVVTVKEINPFVDDNGILKAENLPILFKGEPFPDAFIDTYLRLMQKFEVVLPLDNAGYLIPSRLPEKGSELDKRISFHGIDASKCLRRYYKFSYIPVGFWGRLISRLLFFQSPMRTRTQKDPALNYWRDGILRFWSATKFFVVTMSELVDETLEICVPVSQHGYELIGFLVDHLDALIEEWYPGLTMPYADGSLPVERLVPCIQCVAVQDQHFFTIEQCIAQSYQSDSIWCPSHEGEVELKALTPDVMFADIDGKFFINEGDLDIEQMKESDLGVGSFGSVYQVKMEGKKTVAVKVFRSCGSNSPHRLLRQEVTILQLLHHSSLVSMLGVLLRPQRSLVMELAPKGSLRKVLSCEHLSRGMQHRIASQVADGLAYLHKHDIVYRDMKPSNILIFSLSLGIPINAKISDYGISQYITPQGFSCISGSPGYRAPEVEKGYWVYNKEADIFSLGITLFELVTGGHKPFLESLHLICPNSNSLASSGNVKSLTSTGCSHWPDMQTIIVDSLSYIPDRRPTAEAISNWLSSADSLCLRQEVGVCKGQTVECMAVHKSVDIDKETMELWIGSGGSSEQSQISWLSLVDEGAMASGCRGMILQDERIFCMCTINGNLVLAGTKKGNIVVFDAQSHDRLHTATGLGDSVLCLELYSNDNCYLVIAGLANGQLAIFEGRDFLEADTKPKMQFEVLQNELAELGNGRRHPLTCLETSRRKLYCGVGRYVAVVDPKRGHVERLISAGGELDNVINQLSIWKFIWTSSRGSSVIHCICPLSGSLKGTLDCASVLRSRHPDIAERDCHVLCIYHNCDALWVGCGGGHVIVIEPSPNFRVLAVVKRHSSAVRCILGVNSGIKGKQLSMVLTGGVGFLERSLNAAEEQSSLGCVLVWEAELANQFAYLEQLLKTRQNLYH